MSEPPTDWDKVLAPVRQQAKDLAAAAGLPQEPPRIDTVSDTTREPLSKAMADRPSEATIAANEVMRRVLADPDYGKPPKMTDEESRAHSAADAADLKEWKSYASDIASDKSGNTVALSQAQRDAARASRPAPAPQPAQARQAAQLEAQQSRALVR